MLGMLLINLRKLLRLVNLPETPRNGGYSSAIAKRCTENLRILDRSEIRDRRERKRQSPSLGSETIMDLS
jgi:hypothetical protein